MKKYFYHVLALCLGGLTGCGPQSVCEPDPKLVGRGEAYPRGRCELPSSGQCPDMFVKVVSETPIKKGEKCDYERAVAL